MFIRGFFVGALQLAPGVAEFWSCLLKSHRSQSSSLMVVLEPMIMVSRTDRQGTLVQQLSTLIAKVSGTDLKGFQDRS
jgi:hypothetical protein